MTDSLKPDSQNKQEKKPSANTLRAKTKSKNLKPRENTPEKNQGRPLAPKKPAKTLPQGLSKNSPLNAEHKGKEKPNQKAKPAAKSEKPAAANRPAPKKLPSSKGHGGSEPKLKVIPLGGLGEVGKNMTLLQYEDNIIVVDAGVMFPEDELLGIDMVIPDYSYLLENKEKLKAFLLSHGHEDHIGSLPYVIKSFLDVPIYGSRLALGLLKGKFQEHRINAKMVEVQPRAKIQIGPFIIEPIRVTHSIPDTLSFAIHTPVGRILMMSDFKLDMSPIDGKMMDFGSIARLGEQGVLLLMMDSTNVEKNGFTPSEKMVGSTFDRILLSTSGRVIITSFASNVHRVQQAIWAAEKSRRKVAILGRGMVNVSTIAKELGYLDIPPGILIDVDQANSLPADEVLILTTGSQGEPLAGLSRMAMNEHKQVHIGPGDTVIVSATPIPGNERLVGRTIDNLFRLGANVIYERSEGIHVSGHASREELKVIINMVKPKYFMPMHGEYRMLYKHALLAQQLGIPEENTFVMENGEVLEIGRRRCRISGTVTAGRVLIDGLGIGDVGNTILKERKLLSEGGVVVVNIIYSKKNGKILHGPEIFTRGFIFEKEYEHIIGEARKKVVSICTKNSEDGKIDWNAARGQIRSNLSHFLFDRMGRRPIVLPVITEV